MCEEYLGFKSLGDIPVLGELASVVGSYRADFPDVRQHHRDDGFGQSLCVFTFGEYSAKGEVGVFLHKRHNRALAISAHDSIHLEVSRG